MGKSGVTLFMRAKRSREPAWLLDDRLRNTPERWNRPSATRPLPTGGGGRRLHDEGLPGGSKQLERFWAGRKAFGTSRRSGRPLSAQYEAVTFPEAERAGEVQIQHLGLDHVVAVLVCVRMVKVWPLEPPKVWKRGYYFI